MRAFLLRALAFTLLCSTVTIAQAVQLTAQQLPQLPPQIGPGLVLVPDIRTRIEAALTTPNALVIADYHNIDFRFGPKVRIDAAIVRVGSGPDLIRGLRVQVPDNRPGPDPERSSYVDIEELGPLSESLNLMTDLVKNWTGVDDRRATTLTFTSAGGLRIEVREFGRVQRGLLFTGLIDPVVTSFDLADLTALKQAVDQAWALLKTK